jgi:nucleoside-diphosphate-sugar epimerase
VIGTTRDQAKTGLVASFGARAFVLDVFDRHGVFAAMQQERPDAVIHQLTSLGRADYAANNRIRIEGTRNLVDAAESAGVKRVVAQSYSLYRAGEGLANESDPLDLDSGAYGGSIGGILALEKAIAGAVEGVVLRYGTLYGPGTWFAVDGAAADQVRRVEFVATDEITSFLHVEDAAQAAVLALTWPKGIVNIVDDEPARAIDWAPAFAAAVGALTPQIRAGTGSRYRGVSNVKARHELGWQPVYRSWRDGFRKGLGARDGTQHAGSRGGGA